MLNCCHLLFISDEEDTTEKLRMLVTSVLCDENSKEGKFHLNEENHISLTKTQVIRHHWIQPIKNSLKQRLSKYAS